jgi:hypothetical protein
VLKEKLFDLRWMKIMIQIKFQVKTERYDDNIKKALSEIVEKAATENGCTRCQGKNLTV